LGIKDRRFTRGSLVHKSVLSREALDYLACKKDSIVLDCTLGCAGHAREILEIVSPHGRLIGLDADAQSIDLAKKQLKDYAGSFDIINENFLNIDNVLAKLGIAKVDAMIFDLGISSFQLENDSRGFSFQHNGPLDMRIDRNRGIPLWQALSQMTEAEIAGVIRDLGEERHWRRIAKAIISARRVSPIRDTFRLAEIIGSVSRFRAGDRIHPATRSFQAFRIFINNELDILNKVLLKAPNLLTSKGRLVVISFHSLEDRIVKHTFRLFKQQGVLNILTKKPIRPGQDEISRNPRSRSAKLRAAERI
jgi:16S rRNA (cytosine1402-N4)-methyltransferase